jgi:hypothetical protein
MEAAMTTRRNVIRVIGGAAIVAATGPTVAGCAAGADPAAAWRAPGVGETDPRRRALSFAILAPNPHNMQPWLVALPGADEIVLYVDRTRLLPATDPPNRQITLGCGAFLELLALAAAQDGHRAEITPFPEGEPDGLLDERPVAHVRLIADTSVTRDPLARFILARRTNRNPYDLQRVPSAEALSAVCATAASPGFDARFSNDAAATAQLRDLVWRGWVREQTTPAALQESVDVMRIGAAEIARHRDGLALEGPMIEVLRFTPMLSREALLNPESEANRQGAAQWRRMAETAPAFVWTTSADNTRAAQLTAGRAYARLNLAATAQGLSLHPWSMTLQEYPEMADLYAETRDTLRVADGETLQMLSRIGYAQPAPASPRRGLSEHLLA